MDKIKQQKNADINRLRTKIKDDWNAFNKVLSEMSSKSIISEAPTIYAMQEVYSYLSNYKWPDEYEVEFLLYEENPLYYLTDIWQKALVKFKKKICNILSGAIIDSDDYFNSDLYIDDELRIKHGCDIPLNTAAMLELVVIGKKLLATYERDVHNKNYIYEYNIKKAIKEYNIAGEDGI